MAFTHSRLKEITHVGTSAASVYNNPASTTTHVKTIIIHNLNSSTENVELWNVPDSTGSVGTAADANKMHKMAVEANETVMLEFPGPGLLLEDTNDSIQAKTDTASKVTIQIYGTKDA